MWFTILSNLEDESYTKHLRRWSYLDECPILSTCPENLFENLKALIVNPTGQDLGKASRLYAEKYHGFEAGKYLFQNVIDKLHGDKKSLIDLYHPILTNHTDQKNCSSIKNNKHQQFLDF